MKTTTKRFMWLAGVGAAAVLAGAALAGHHRSGPAGFGPHHDGPRGGAMGLRALQAADADGDLAVTREEVEAFQAEMFAWRDRNGDGRLDGGDRSPLHQHLAEVRADRADEARDADEAVGPRRGRAGPRHLRARDADGDGAVSREEYLAGALERFARLDTDSDTVIEPEELDAALARHTERMRWWSGE